MPRPKVAKREILRLVKLWQRRLGLDAWKLTIVVQAAAGEDDGIAHARAQPEYRQATLFFDPFAIDPPDLEATVCHELCHLILWKAFRLTEQLAGDNQHFIAASRWEEEEATTHLERAFMNAWTD